MVSRRAFIKSSGLALFGLGLGGVPQFMARAASIEKTLPLYARRKVLVCIFQRGAMDGLMAVTPFTDEHLKTARPGIFIPPTGDIASRLIDLDGRFGLHPSMSTFEPLFRENRLAIVHGMGSPNTTRSHFDAQDYMESGTPFRKGTPSGWLNRAVGLLGHEASALQAVSFTPSLPRSFYGDHAAVAIRDLKDFSVQLKGNPGAANAAARSFEELYDETTATLLKDTGKESFDAMKLLQKATVRKYEPANGALYPGSALGNSLKQIAQLIKMDVGLEVAFAESGGWDTHLNQGTATGTFARNVNDLSRSMTAFWTDLGAYQDDVTLMTMTEFGRTVKQNGSGGTDHGRGSCLFVLGNGVNGGKVHGQIDPLAVENLEDGRDLKVTTDFRSIFSDVCGSHLKLTDRSSLFPDWKGSPIGLMRS
jgi:uncharacterized protein (DUF1501 family)